jgi:hypothetical protein
VLWLAMLPLLALAAPQFAARAFIPRWGDRLSARFAAARLDLDMTR